MEIRTAKPIGRKRGEILKTVLLNNSNGLRIKELLEQSGYPFEDTDWNDIEPYWIGVELNGKIVGCIQVCPGKPMGRLELMAVDPEVNPRMRPLVVKQLTLAGISTLTQMGSQFASTIIAFENKSWKQFLKKHHGVVTFVTGNMLIKRL